MSSPLNKIGMPYYREALLSAWPSHMVFEVGAPPPKIDPAIQSLLRKAPSDLGSWATNPRKTLRNQVVNTRAKEHSKDAPLEAPKFLHEKAREARDAAAALQEDRRMSETLETMAEAMLEGATKKDVPVMYRNVEIKYSKFGVDDFDFGFVHLNQHS
jgi:PAB-dependent poly(A)-specific ribonuclease subunit 2